jgi:phosphoribosylformylglycinamidine synthase II
MTDVDGIPLHRRLGVTDDELEAIRARMGRDPNHLELAMFSVMWSEHCSYKSSKPLLRTLPTAGEGVVAGPGENAGVISIGDGLAVAFKIESHNHPSAVEPYQGAATGVGGILRDIFTMGARPVAVLDALRFGDPADSRTRHLVNGVVRGVGGYGNCVGVPTIGGELVFDPSYGGNPLVNVMAIGVLPEDRLTLAQAPGPGNLAVLFGSTTGRDGIGGASVLASATFAEDDPSKRPSVQVGDPFAEKLLIEASLELIERGLVEGLQDLGAAGITCATSETADRSGTGILVDLDAIPRREPGLEPFEVMISESQERMLAIVRPERFEAIREVCERWGLPVAVIGRITDDGDVAVVTGGLDAAGRPNAGATELARIPARALTSDAIVHARVARPPARRRSAARTSRATRFPSGAWIRGPCCRRSSARRTCRAGAGSTSSTTATSWPIRSSVRAAGRQCCASRGRRRASSRRPTRTTPSGGSTRTSARRSAWRRRRATCRSPGRVRSGSRTA